MDFQDYNVEVLEHITIPNMLLNDPSAASADAGGAATAHDDGTVPNATINGTPQYVIDHGPLPEDDDEVILRAFLADEKDENEDEDEDDGDEGEAKAAEGSHANGGGNSNGGGSGSIAAAAAAAKRRPTEASADVEEPTSKRVRIDPTQQSQQSNTYVPRFFGGGWAELPAFLSTEAKSGHDGNGTYDVILTAETIYSIESSRDLHTTLAKCTRPGGCVYVAAKTYYFGVGGGTLSFTNLVNEKGLFSIQSVWKSDTGVSREILKLTRK